MTLLRVPEIGETMPSPRRLIALLNGFNRLLDAVTGNRTEALTILGAITATGGISLSTGGILPGTYTPTLTNTTNLDGSTAYRWMYMRLGNLVFATGPFAADPTAGAPTLTELGLSLPVASALTDATIHLRGGGVIQQGSTFLPIQVLADAANDRARLLWYATDTANNGGSAWYMYEILP